MRTKIMLVVWLLALLADVAFAQTAMQSPGAEGGAVDDLSNGLGLIVTSVGRYLVPLAAASTLTVALLEAFKKLLSMRGRFHRAAVVRWLSQNDDAIPARLKGAVSGVMGMLHGRGHYDVRAEQRAGARLDGKDGDNWRDGAYVEVYSPSEAYAEFFHLTSGQAQPAELNPRADWFHWRGIDRAVFELEIARMMSQVQDAADATLNNPSLYPHLYQFFTRGSDPGDVEKWRRYISSVVPAGAEKENADRYGRIRLLMRRQLDAFQGVTTSRWEELNQLWAVVVGAVVLFVAQIITLDHSAPGLAAPLLSLEKGWAIAWHPHGGEPLITAILFRSLLGGVLAPIAKDVLSAISQIKLK